MLDALPADGVILALACDISAIGERTGKIPADWQSRLFNNSAPYTCTVVCPVRKANPKGIRDWDDLVRPSAQLITPNPKASGAAMSTNSQSDLAGFPFSSR